MAMQKLFCFVTNEKYPGEKDGFALWNNIFTAFLFQTW